MAAEIVHYDDIAWPQRGHQELRNPGEEADGVDQLTPHIRCNDAIAAQSGNEGQCLPVSGRHLGDQVPSTGTASVRVGHFGLHPSLFDEDQTFWSIFP